MALKRALEGRELQRVYNGTEAQARALQGRTSPGQPREVQGGPGRPFKEATKGGPLKRALKRAFRGPYKALKRASKGGPGRPFK